MRALKLLSVILALVPLAPAVAEQAVTVGDYSIHYNALPTDALTAEVARTYGIKRSRARALVNVSVLKRNMEVTGQPVPARVEAQAINLNSQLREIPMRKVEEGSAIYYIGEVGVSDGETLKFTLTVQAEGMTEPAVVRFDQQFFTE